MESQFVLAGALLLGAGAITSLPAQLDLTPQPGVYIGEGTPFPCIRFRDGAGIARFMPPPGWNFAADGPRCVFHPKGVAQATGSFSAKPLPDDGAASDPERLRALLASTFPSGAADVQLKLEGLPGVKLEHWEARHIQGSYEHFGQKFRVALLVVPLEREELHIRFDSRAADFERAFMPFLESLGTFTWNPTDEDPEPAKPAKRDR